MAEGGEGFNQDVSGYIHEVSDVKIGAKSGVRYFDFKVQQDGCQKRVVCYNANRRTDLKERQTSKSPTRLVNVSPQKRSISNELEFKMNKYSKIQEERSITFPWKNIKAEKVSDEISSIFDVLHKRENGDFVNVKVHVGSKSLPETVHSSPGP